MPYAIMLDKDRNSGAYSGYWPVVFERDTIAELRQIDQHMGNPKVIPQNGIRMEMIEVKSLINSENGETDSGAIYREWSD